ANARHYPAISWIDSYSEYAIELEEWWGGVNRLWNDSRKAALELLKKEQRLAEIVRLIGPDALPDEQKLIMVVADIIKNGFLQQNSFDEVDMYCAPPKQVALLCLIMEFYTKAAVCLKQGAALPEVMAHNVKENISRLKSKITNDDLPQLEQFGIQTQKELDAILRRYASRKTSAASSIA
ncbi:MAG: V-type ATP synthase subunit A, partial [Spirochaetaceae bacterium]|nr:V-type ATP synthase subunit A [Spirochaetaceae bacterium]